MRKFATAALASLAACTTVGTAKAAPAGRETAAQTADRLFQPWASKSTPGCAVGVSKDGRTVLSKAYGMADLDHDVANSAATVFEAGSTSKQFAAAAVLLLVDDGKLALTDDIRKHLPEMPDYGQVITVDHLLRHTSGLRDWRYVAAVGGDLPGEHAHTNADAFAIASLQRGLNHQPGEEYAYTNTGYTLLAVIVERVSGRSLAAFSQERMFKPLGMNSTEWRDDFRRVVKGRARAYSKAGEVYAEDMPFESTYGAGGLLTTVGDLLIWNEALDAGRLGRGVTARLQEPGRLNDGQPITYARGLFVERHRGTLEVGHRGITGGYRTWAGRYPEHRLSIAVLCNGDAAPETFGREIADAFLPAAAPAAETNSAEAAAEPASPAGRASLTTVARPRWRPATEELAGFTGRYASDEAGAVYLAAVEEGRLVLRLQGRAGRPLTLGPSYQDAFLFTGGRVQFQRAAGRVSGMTIDVQRAEGVRFVRTP